MSTVLMSKASVSSVLLSLADLSLVQESVGLALLDMSLSNLSCTPHQLCIVNNETQRSNSPLRTSCSTAFRQGVGD